MSSKLATVKAELPVAKNAATAFDGVPTGLEKLTARDLIIPRLTILQGLSPQVTQGKPEYDPNAKVGDIYDIGLQERFPNGIEFIPVMYQKQWLEWAPRQSGKGLVAIHYDDEIMDETVDDEKTGRAVLPNGNYIAETAQFYGLNVAADFRRSFLPMASTQLKKARRLLTLAASEKLTRDDGSPFQPPIYFRAYKLTTIPESNNQGNWIGWKIERARALPEMGEGWREVLNDAKLFRESLIKGEIKGDISDIPDERAHSDNAPL